MDGQVTWSDLGILFGRTLSEHSAATEEKTSTPCWKKLRVSQNQDFLYLDCRKSGNGQKQEPSTVMGGLSLGELTTLNAGEKPSETAVQEMLSVWGPHSVAEESRLSQILEANPLPKYNLTAKACLGLLRRAERRGKNLPERLKQVLLMQSASGGGCDEGEKGALVQTEKSGTLGTVNDQTIFAAIPINDKATRWQGGGESRNHDGSGNGLGIGKEGDPSPTLTAGDRHGVICLTPWEAQSQKVYDVNGVSQTLCAYQNSGMNREAVLCARIKTGQGAQAGGIGYGEEVSPMLAAAPSSTNQTPAVMAFAANQRDEVRDLHDVAGALGAQPGMKQQTFIAAGFKLGNSEQARSIGYQEELSPTLNAECGGNKPAVVALDMTHACDVIRECGEQAPSLQARMGTGCNQVPLTYQDVTGTLSPGAHAGSYNGQDAYNDMLVCGASPDVAHTLRAKANCAYREDAETYPVQNMVVRRLTPMECERLQGFPDHWTDIGEWTDEKGKKHKDADSPRYKALGNSIALPFWDWMLRRMARYLPEDATLGSLFDGISGFNVCWARIHGAECCRWSSEIEQFPIAVVKKHFGDEEAGKEGDWWKFSGM